MLVVETALPRPMGLLKNGITAAPNTPRGLEQRDDEFLELWLTVDKNRAYAKQFPSELDNSPLHLHFIAQ